MANVSSNNLTSLYGGGGSTVLPTTPVPVVDSSIASKNLTTLYSGAGAPVIPTTPYGNANVERFLNSGTDGGNTIENIIANANITANYYYGNGYYLTDVTSSNANYANFAGEAFDVSVSNVSGIGNIAVINLDGNVSNVLNGDGVFRAPTGNLNANFAAYAGNVTVNAQPNITTVGNLIYLNVRDNSNANSVIRQFTPNSITIPGNFTNNAVYDVATVYWPNASTGMPVSGVIRSRGNATSPTTAVAGDRISQNRYMAYNGNINVLALSETISLSGTINSNSNATYTGAVWTLSTGNPSGDIGNTNANSGLNQLQFTNSGALVITPGTAPNTNQTTSSILITNFGQSTANLIRAGGLNFQKARGNRDLPQSVQPNDIIATSFFIAYSNGAYQSSNIAQYRVVVDSSYVANDTIVPLNHQFQTVANVGNVATFLNTTFYSNGTAVFPGNINTSSTVNTNDLNVASNAIIGNITDVDSITFDTSNVAPGAVGRFTWNDGDGTLDLGLKGGNVTLQLGEELVTRVYNDDVVTLTDGMIVQITGAQGNRISVQRAQADIEANSVHTLGMVTESIAVGAEGFITTTGTVNKLNTIGLTEGATLYLSPSTLGGYTETKPTAPDQLVIVGFVQRVHATVGSIYVKVDNGYELDELHNVLITSPVAGQALVYNSSNLWVNGVPAYANTANSVSVANVVGIGNIATINLNGNASQVLYGNGVFAAGGGGSGGNSISNGTSNVNIPIIDGNVTVGVSGNSNVAIFTGTGLVLGNLTLNSTNVQLGLGTANGGSPGSNRVAIGANAGSGNSGSYTIAIGDYASIATAWPGSIAIGRQAAFSGLGNSSIAIGANAGTVGTGDYCITIGETARAFYSNTISIGAYAGTGAGNQGNNTIVLNATGANLQTTTANTFTVKPIRNATTSNLLFYSNTTGEITYSNNITLTQFQETVISGGNTGTSISPNVANGTIYSYTANNNFTFNSLTSAVAGTSATIIITQDGTGSRLLTSTMLFAGASKTLSTTAGAKDIISVFYDGTTYWATLSKGYA